MFSRFGVWLIGLWIFIALFCLTTNIIYIFPAYMNLVYDSYQLAECASHDNYLDEDFKVILQDKIVNSHLCINDYVDGTSVEIECFDAGDSGGQYLIKSRTAGDYNNFIISTAKQRGDNFKIRLSYDYLIKIKMPDTNLTSPSLVVHPIRLTSERTVKAEKFYAVK